MSAGQLDRRIAVQKRTGDVDAYGEQLDQWATVATVWAQIKKRSGAQFFNSEAEVSRVGAVFVVRYRSDIARDMHVVFEGERYEIDDMREVNRRDYLELHCRYVAS